MSELERIGQLLRSVWNGPAWHGPAVWQVLEDVKAEDADRRVGGAHTMLELVSHMAVWEEAVAFRIETGMARVADKDNFGVPTGDDAWRVAIDRLRTAQNRLLEVISSLNDMDLDRRIQGDDPEPHTLRFTLYGLVHHDLYHSGQIQILKRALSK